MQKLFSGVQPSGNLHIGNYLGAIKQWVALQSEHESIFCVVDLHAITVPQDPDELRKKTLEIAKIYLASGIDPEKSTLFVQSHVSAHSELMWILNTIVQNGDLTKMTQFKDKSGVDADEFEDALRDMMYEKHDDEVYKSLDGMSTEQIFESANKASFDTAAEFFKRFKLGFNSVGTGLYDYPVLMAADILLYDTNVVPVGDDQLQHIELARTLARRFNERFGKTFVVPEGRIQQEGARIMGLDDPTKKMSKSAASEYNYISLTDDVATVQKKVKKAVTDSATDITYSDDRPGLKNLINIYSLFSDKSPKEIETLYVGKGYGDFKADLAKVISSFLTPFQERFNAISDDEVKAILADGALKAQMQAEAKMKKVREKVGLL
jgi:tryptophanyl-tRNA synthetase